MELIFAQTSANRLPNTGWFQTCSTDCCSAKKLLQLLQRHLTVCRFGLVWSRRRCCKRCSLMPKISEQFCHWIRWARKQVFYDQGEKRPDKKNQSELWRSPHPAVEVLHQVDLHSLYAAIIAACVNLQEANTQFNTSPFTFDLCEHQESPYHTLMHSHTHHRITVTPIHLQTVMWL